MSATKEGTTSIGPVEREVVFGRNSNKKFGPINAGPELTMGGTSYRWVTQLTINGESYGSAEGKHIKQNLVLTPGEYIKSFKAYRWMGDYNFITSIRIMTNRGQYWVLEGREKPEKTRERYLKLELEDIRVLSIAGSHGGLGNSLKQFKIRYLENYSVEDAPVDTGNKNLYAIMHVAPPGKVETYESAETRTLDAITTISELTANIETEVTQSYLLAEATTRLGLSYMNREQVHTERERLETHSIKSTVKIPDGSYGIGLCRVEIKKMTLPGNETRYLIVPTESRTIYPKTIDEIKAMNFFDISQNLQAMIPDLKYSTDSSINYGSTYFHEAE